MAKQTKKQKRSELLVETIGGDSFSIYINGIKYRAKDVKYKKIDGVTHLDKIVYGVVNDADFVKNKNIIISELAKHTSAEELLGQLLQHVGPQNCKELADKISKGSKVKKQLGCLGFKIGGKYVQVID
jgi:hypothetical protein